MPGVRRKHVPMRTCIVCRQRRAKRELARVVRTPEGTIVIDPKGKQAGRGAYMCLARECLDAGLKPDRLGRALKCRVSAGDVAALEPEVQLLLASMDEL